MNGMTEVKLAVNTLNEARFYELHISPLKIPAIAGYPPPADRNRLHAEIRTGFKMKAEAFVDGASE